jgi:hypothetical protein
MELNADFSKRVAVHSARLPWTPSPIEGVDRRMLDRTSEAARWARCCHLLLTDNPLSARAIPVSQPRVSATGQFRKVATYLGADTGTELLNASMGLAPSEASNAHI